MALEWASSWRIIEQAKEELQILEAQHPNRFEYLKLELKSFIFVESQKLQLLTNDHDTTLSTSSTAPTQGSTSRKRKSTSGGSTILQEMMEGNNNINVEKAAKKQQFEKRDRVDEVLERAQACLQKIGDFKTKIF